MRALLLAAALLIATGAQAQTARVTPAPAVTATSQIFGDPALPGTPEAAEFAARGYVREEVFLSGAANVYRYGPQGALEVETKAVPYTTRMVIVRPREPKPFSGVVHLEPIHPLNGGGGWAVVRDHALARGDAWVGVMIGGDANSRGASRPDAPTAAPLVLRWIDPQRYAAIDWPTEEDGIRWDVFFQAAEKLRAPVGPLKGLKVERVYAQGWSFTGSFLRTFVNEGFHDRLRDARGRPLIDGYLMGISSSSFRSGYTPINSRAPVVTDADPRRRNRAIDVPVIELMSENEAITNRAPQTTDSDGARRHRLYEAPGLTHGSGGRSKTNVVELQRARRSGASPAPPPADATCPFPNTDIEMSHFAHTALANLDRWTRDGTPPPRAERLKVDAQFRQVRDAAGNALGGVRAAQLDVPLARYGEAPDGLCAPRRGIGSPVIPMRRIPLSAERLRQLYPGGRADYLRRFDARVAAMVAERWLTADDAAIQKREARAAADAAFGG